MNCTNHWNMKWVCLLHGWLGPLAAHKGSRWDHEQGGGAGPSAQKRSWAGRWSWAAKVGPLSLQVVPQQRCSRHCCCDCPSMAVETAVAQCTSRWAMARGHRLNTSVVLAAVHGLSGLFQAVSTVEPSRFRPLPTLSPSLISILASVDVKQNGLVWSNGSVGNTHAGGASLYRHVHSKS